jgi:hypothetical protein
MAVLVKNGVVTTPYKLSKLAQQSFLASSRVGLIFTFNQSFDTNIDQQDFSNAADKPYDAAAADTFSVGAGYGKLPNKFQSGGQRELIVGAGWRSVNVEQQINVTQEGALGHFDLLETIEHNVASNTMTVDRMALRLALLSQLGVAPFGKDVLTSPALNCYIYDPKERQRGFNVGYLKVIGLHLQSNRFSSNVGSVAMENVTFRPNRIVRVQNALPIGMLKELSTVYPSIYSGIETLENASFTDLGASL